MIMFGPQLCLVCTIYLLKRSSCHFNNDSSGWIFQLYFDTCWVFFVNVIEKNIWRSCKRLWSLLLSCLLKFVLSSIIERMSNKRRFTQPERSAMIFWVSRYDIDLFLGTLLCAFACLTSPWVMNDVLHVKWIRNQPEVIQGMRVTNSNAQILESRNDANGWLTLGKSKLVYVFSNAIQLNVKTLLVFFLCS